MQLTITEKKENAFLKRFEVRGKVKFDGVTPTNALVAESLAKELNLAPELVVMKKIHSGFGSQEAEVLAYAYQNAEAKSKEVLLPHQKKKAAGEAKEEKK